MSAAEASVGDPASAPVYPVVRLMTAPGEVLVDGVPASAGRGESLMDAAIAMVARRAATSNARMVRVVVVDESGREFWHVVDAAGGVHDLVHGQQRPRTRQVSRRRTLAAAGVAGGVFVVAAASVGVAVIASTSSSRAAAPVRTVTVAPSATATQLPAAGVSGWSSGARWGSPQVASISSTEPAVAVTSGGAVFAALGSASSTSVSVARLSPATGQPLWKVGVPGQRVLQGPVFATVSGHRMVLVATDAAVSGVDLTTRRVSSWSIPSGSGASGVQLTAAGPVIPTSSASASVVDSSLTMAPRSVPAGAAGWVPLPDGQLLASDASGRVWRSGSAQVAGAPVQLAGPKGLSGAGTGVATSRVLVQQWSSSTAGSAGVVLRGYAVSTLKPLWTSSTVPAPVSGQTRLFGSWWWTGAVLVDVSTGHVVSLPQGMTVVGVDHGLIWATDTSGAIASYDLDGHQVTAAVDQPASSAGTVAQAIPVGMIGQQLLVSAATDSSGDLRLYLLPSTSASSSASGSPSALPSSTSPASSSTASPSKVKTR
ncbi:hypothetical protein [Rudaeicoccus suwonensis]|uniref:Uncharacterized protein n=1 Tax=Rudaeicoccus suwonensis TaxID=657409 RepID=A0A561DVI1_9MICO|nr:hypothetical protein [Rudaeicoccus suwonensis]TWE07365.1 hypothetical protein BKA23_3378 [Rudaeicoccus suwonensis]